MSLPLKDKSLGVTLRANASNAERYERLKLWIEFVNLFERAFRESPVPDPPLENQANADFVRFIQSAPDTRYFPGEQLRRWLREYAAFEQFVQLLTNVARTLRFCASEGPEKLDLNLIPPVPQVLDRSETLLKVETYDPYRDYFVKAIEGVEHARIRRCPICAKFFYAVRGPGKSERSGTKACSKRCNQARKQREWREQERKRTETTRILLQEGSSVMQIAEALRVSTKKAREYVAHTRKERGK
jgi:hypothetical protein